MTEQIKITFRKKLRADYVWGMSATIQFRIFSSQHLSEQAKIMIKVYYVFTCCFVYKYEISFCMLRDEHRLMGLENRVLRIFGSKREEVTGCRRKLHN